MPARIAMKPHNRRRPGNSRAVPIDDCIPQFDRLDRDPLTARALCVGPFDPRPIDNVGKPPISHAEGYSIVGKHLRSFVLNLRGRTVHRQLDHSNILARFVDAIHRDRE